ncbi:MAG: glycosyltransferase family 2 protein [Gammaproteobacteria bacterium]
MQGTAIREATAGAGAGPAAAGAEPVALSVVIPARNEEAGLGSLLPRLRQACPEAEIVVVDDGSTDGTAAVALAHGAVLIRHPYAMGNGSAVKTGARHARGEVLVMMDGDGQHDPTDIARLLERLDAGYDMAVGARDSGSQASFARLFGNAFYNRFASWMVNQRVDDLTSGFRAVRAARFREVLHLLPNGFSYPTTSTMAFFRNGYPVAYVPIQAARRIGRSHLKPLRDGIRFLMIMFRIGTLYAPLKVFLPISTLMFALGALHYLNTYLDSGRFTNMSALLFIASMLIFLIGLVSEQITMLLYQKPDR